jgi:hypothetical protein
MPFRRVPYCTLGRGQREYDQVSVDDLIVVAEGQLSHRYSWHSPKGTDTPRKKESVMELTFTRSGGFAGSATAIEGKVTFDGGVARVTSGLGYQRDLTPEEIQALLAAIGQFPQRPPVSSGQLRDEYQYDIRITRDDGHTQDLTVHGDSSPGIENLPDWVRRECDLIWTHRINKRLD